MLLFRDVKVLVETCITLVSFDDSVSVLMTSVHDLSELKFSSVVFVRFINYRTPCGGGYPGRQWKGHNFDLRNRLLKYSAIYVVIIVILGR